MKTRKFLLKQYDSIFSIKILLVLGLIISPMINSTECVAQDNWGSSKVKAKSTQYECTKDHGTVYIKNTSYEEITKSRKEYDNNQREYSYVKLLTHDTFLKSFNETFTGKRISQLSDLEEIITVSFSIGEKGQILSLRFSFKDGTSLTPSEIEVLEGAMLKNVKFGIIGYKVEEPIFYYVHIRVKFSEVKKGEIRFARAMEQKDSPYK